MKKPNDIFLVGNVALEDEDLRSVFTKFSGFTKFISTSRNNGDVPVCIGKGDGRRTSYAYTKDHSECEDRLVVGLPEEAPVTIATLEGMLELLDG